MKWQKVTGGGVSGLALSASMALAAGAQGQDGSANNNRFGVSAQFLFNVSAKFSHLATPVNPGPGPGVHAADHVYDDGYVLVDDSGNVGNQTWNWGFSDPASLVGNTLELHTMRSPADGTTQRATDDPQYGFEINYGRVLTSFSEGKVLLGLQGAFGMTWLDIQNRGVIAGTTTGVKDVYDLSGLPLLPGAPYIGSAPIPGGPLPLLLPDSPTTRTPVSLPATATERMKVEGELYGFKIGPFFEAPLSKAISLHVQGGFAALLADAKFSYNEVISTGGTSAAALSRSQWRCGGFVEGQFLVTLTKHWSGFVGAGWQRVEDYTVRAGTKAARVKLDNVVSAFAGLGYSF